jgi:anti-sigma B factor antagonist
MDDKKIQIQEEEKGTYYYIKAKGHFSSINILEVRRPLEYALSIGHTKLALDLSEVTFMDSMGLGLMINFFKKMRDSGGRLVVINPSETVFNLINVSGTGKVLEIHQGITNPDTLF